ncbi:ABC transporter permease [Dyadobacter bucti]|uniref:ABC transporter permease n=1 Tax=Dyadobacter bucti TaxID=2572203 RepID=UPI003F72D315
MLRNYLKIALRNLVKKKLYTFLNIAGLAMGIAVAVLVGLWVYDEVSFNAYNGNFDRIALVQKNKTYDGTIHTETSNSVPLGAKLRETYGGYFDAIVVSSYGAERTLKSGETTVVKRGYFMENGGEQILDLKLVKGFTTFPIDPSSILISESLSKSLFANADPVGKIVKIDQKIDVKVAGVYKNIPVNSTFRNVSFYGSFETYAKMEEWVENSKTDWSANSYPIYVKMAPHVDVEEVSAKISNVDFEVTKDESRPALFLYPMSKWHLYPEFKNGVNIGTGLQSIVGFGLTGVFVLLLAAVNFMNLSTARSEVRAREVGIRKALGSERSQLVRQFYVETFLTVVLSGIAGLLVARLALPWFNQISEKSLTFLWHHTYFWVPFLAFIILTGLISGSYPAFYLSSFIPVKVLKGVLKTSRTEIFSRKALVVFQFSISIFLIIAMTIVNRQIRFARDRPIGYDTNGLIQIRKSSPDLSGHFFAMRQDMHNSGAIVEMAEANGPISEWWHSNSQIKWRGKPSNTAEEFVTLSVTPEFGKTIGWKIVKGRDFDRKFSLDTASVILNEAAATRMGFADPVGETIRFEGKNYQIVGLSQNVVMDSPFDPVKPTVFIGRNANLPFITIKLNPEMSIATSVKKVEAVLGKYDPGATFNIKFADAEFGLKFWRENRIAQLVKVFSALAILISLLGIFGLATFMAEQRTKEIGVRKVLGASVSQLWALLSKDFVAMIVISLLIASPVAWYFMDQWLMKYEYRTTISWWIFAASGLGTILLTLLTVSFQAFRAALLDPVRSLKTE